MKDVLKLALEALCVAVEPKKGKVYAREFEPIDCFAMHEQAITALREALAQPVQEPVAVKHMLQWTERLKSLSNHGQYLNIPGLGAGACWELANELEQFIKTAPAAQTEQEPIADVRGLLAARLTCWHRLTGLESDELVALFQALPAQPAQEPDELTIAYMSGLYDGKKKRTWVGLTDDELLHIGVATGLERAAAHMIEQALKGKNT